MACKFYCTTTGECQRMTHKEYRMKASLVKLKVTNENELDDNQFKKTIEKHRN